MSEEDMDRIFRQLEERKRASKYNYYRKELIEEIIKNEDEIERLNNIIKEVREYIQRNCILSDEWTELDFGNFIPTGRIKYKQLTPKKVEKLLEILDKGE